MAPPPTGRWSRIPLDLDDRVRASVRLVGVEGGEGAFAFGIDPWGGTWLRDVQRADSPVVSLDGDRVARIFRKPDVEGFLVLTVRDASLCLRRLAPAAAGELRDIACHADVRPLAATLHREGIALWFDGPPLKFEAWPSPGGVAASGRRLTLGKERIGASDATREGEDDDERDLRELQSRVFSTTGELESVPTTSDIRFEPAQLGMSLIEAKSRNDGADLLFYERFVQELYPGYPEPKEKKDEEAPLGLAQIATAHVDDGGTVVPFTRAPVAQSALAYGQIHGAYAPVLWSDGQTSIFLARTSERGPCRGRAVLPKLLPTAVDELGCKVAPQRFASAAAIPEAFAKELFALGPARAPLQSRYEPAQVVWSGGTAFFFAESDGALIRAQDSAPVERLEDPLSVPAHDVVAAGFRRDGTAAVLVGETLRIVRPGDEDGSASRSLSVSAPVRAEGELVDTIAWVGEEPIVERFGLRSSRGAEGATHPDGMTLVGGREAGWLFSYRDARLTVQRVSPGGALETGLTLLEGVEAARELHAVPLPNGGAIAIAFTAAGAQAIAIDEEARAGAPRPVDGFTPSDRLQLSPLPQGGALLFDQARTKVAWLTPSGATSAAAAWPISDSAKSSVCRRGRREPLAWPSPTPGRFVDVLELAQPGVCAMTPPHWSADGSLRWVASQEMSFPPRLELHAAKLGEAIPETNGAEGAAGQAPLAAAGPARCPRDMVLVEGILCVDRYEARITDAAYRPLSPYFPKTPNLLRIVSERWATQGESMGDLAARSTPLPALPAFQIGAELELIAVAQRGVIPHGYATGLVAEQACENAGKRLCREEEWKKACRGESGRLFPYGDSYEPNVCNVDRPHHPAALLHGHPSVGHLDPRLNQLVVDGEPLLETTGSRPRCASRWGDDAIYDMVGNLDEWIDDDDGTFAGGFYARGTKAGCGALVKAHPKNYLDYSTGVRCCRDASP